MNILFFVHSFYWSLLTLNTCKILKTCVPVNTLAGYNVTIWRLIRDGVTHLKPREKINPQWTCYFVHSLQWSLWTLNAYKLLKTRVPVNTLVGHKLTIWRLLRGWTRPSESSIWNTSPIKMLFCTLIREIVLNSKCLQNHKKLCPRKHPSWRQI